MGQPAELTAASRKLLSHHLYEYKKGVRHMFLMTASAREAPAITRRLETDAVDYHLQRVSATKVNLFFGRRAMVDTAREVVTKPLNQLSPQEDFILGTLLGYDREEQCRRYLTKCGVSDGVCPPEGCEDCPVE